eukprot:6972600-Prymnesium_polylepis.1
MEDQQRAADQRAAANSGQAADTPSRASAPRWPRRGTGCAVGRSPAASPISGDDRSPPLPLPLPLPR